MSGRTAKIWRTQGKWNFDLVARNGRIVAFSNQGYARKVDMMRVLRTYFPTFTIVEK